MNTNTSGPDLSGDTESVTEQVVDPKSKHEAHPLHILQQEISEMPAIDQAKVEAALLKEGFLNEALGSDIFSKAGRYKILLNINSLDK